MADGRKEVLGEVWFPVGEVSVESLRERSAPTALPPIYYIHVWFARRPLVASRAAIIGSICSKDSDKKKIMNLLGIPNNIDIVKHYKEFLRSKSEKNKSTLPFTWKRSFTMNPKKEDLFNLIFEDFKQKETIKILDPFSGGGSIPLESIRLGCDTYCNDLNPVAYICLKSTIEFPQKYGTEIINDVDKFCQEVYNLSKKELDKYYPKEKGEEIYAYLWARIYRCNHCGLNIPLSPNWWLSNKEMGGVATRLLYSNDNDVCSFEIINEPKKKGFDPDIGTISGGDAICPRCGSTIDGDLIKKAAIEGKLGHQNYSICSKVETGIKGKKQWLFRTPRQNELYIINDENFKKSLHEDINLIPNEIIEDGLKTREPLSMGIKKWKDFFNYRQLKSHITYLKYFNALKNELLNESLTKEQLEYRKAIVTYSALVFSRCINYNSIQCRWHSGRSVIAGSMDMQAFPIRWSYAEFDHSSMLWPWSLEKTIKSIKELANYSSYSSSYVKITQSPAQSLPYSDKFFDAVVTDPPYSGNVMYAEISDYFYVWLKRLLGDIYPNEFSENITNKTEEAVSNPSRFSGIKGAKNLAEQDYAAKMEASFREMHRVLSDDGVLCVMFTHRQAEAWESLAESLMNAGFILRSSWPIHTEPGDKFGKANKGALKVTIFLYCRKRTERCPGRWEDVVEEIRNIAHVKVKEYQGYGITGPDLLVSLYGPALGKFSEYYPVKDITGKTIKSGEALSIVAQVVNEYLTGDIRGADMEALAYLNLLRNAPGLLIEYDLARLTTVFGGNTSVDALDMKGGSGLVKKSGSKVKILTAKNRLELGILNPDRTEKFKGLMDVVHAAILIYERQGIDSVTRLLQETGRDTHDAGIISVLSAIGAIGEDASSDLVAEARMANALLEALGHSPAGVGKSGERITHYM